MRPLRVQTVDPCRADLPQGHRLCRLAQVSIVVTRCIACITATGVMRVQRGGHTQATENKDLNRKVGDETSESAEFPGDEGTGFCYSELNLRLFMSRSLILESSVERGIPSFAAAPSGPATFPLLSAKAASMISFS